MKVIQPNTGNSLVDTMVGTICSIASMLLGWIPIQSMVEAALITVVSVTVSFLVSKFWRYHYDKLKSFLHELLRTFKRHLKGKKNG